MRLLRILFLTLALPHLAFCGGFSSWTRDTPGGNTICGEKFILIYCNYMRGVHQSQKCVDHIERWYFFRNHIVGNYWQDSVQQYFIFNETDCTCQTFNNEQDFEKSRVAQKLEPFFWTRWYSTYWGVIIGEGNFRAFFDKLPVRLLILCFFVFTPIQLIRTRFSPKNRINQCLLLAFCLIALRIWLDVHPQSF